MTTYGNGELAVERITGELFGRLFPEYDDHAFLSSAELFHKRFEANGFDTRWFQGKTCLDAGCGGGRYSIAMALLGSSRVEGIDVSQASIADARHRALNFMLPQVHFQVGSILGLPYRDASFDFVCCSGVLMIVKDQEKAISELSRVLRRGGLLYLLVYATEGLRWPLIQLVRPIARDIGFEAVDRAVTLAGLPVNKRRTYLDDLFCPILEFYTWDRLRGMLARYGFDRVQRWERGRFDHEEDLNAYREDLEGLLSLWEAGATANDPIVRPHRGRFTVGSQLIQAVVTVVRQAEVEVGHGDITKAEAMRRIVGQGHHRVIAWKTAPTGA